LTATPTASPSGTPTATPTSAAGDATTCTDWAKDGAEFTKAAKSLTFASYCAVLPSGWYVSSMTWEQPKGVTGKMIVSYTNKKGNTFLVSEGNFCPGCAWVDISNLGSASFGGLPATLRLRLAGQYSLYVHPGEDVQYQILSKGMTKAAFVAIAAAMVKIPKV
jgi:hypothetical protein